MKIFETFNKLIGNIKVSEKNNLVKVIGIDALIMKKHIKTYLETDQVSKFMFTSMTNTSFSFNSFFLPDCLYILTKLKEDPHCKWGAKSSIEKIIQGIHHNTWFGRTLNDPEPIIDLKQIRRLTVKPMEKQLEWLRLFGDRIPRYDLNGYILGAAPGAGKSQRLDSKILTPTGWVRNGDLKLNQLISMPDGTTAPVIGIYPQGEVDIYRITLEDGRKTECCIEHLWKFYSNKTTDEYRIASLDDIVKEMSFGEATEDVYIPVTDENFAPSRSKLIHVEHVGMFEAQCIMVDHPDHLYITDDYIVTHNTISSLLTVACVIPPSIAEVKIIISPKKALHLVWEKTIRSVFRKKPTFWCSDSKEKMPTKDTEYYIFNYEALDKAIELAHALKAKNVRYFVIVDESHNFADYKSQRTQKLVTLQTLRDDIHFVWMSGTPIIKHGAELVSFLKCTDPRFDSDAFQRFKKIYTVAPGRANEIFNHRLGNMMAFLVPKSEIMKEKPTIKELPVKLPPSVANKFLMETVKEEMKEFIKERLKFYEGEMKSLRTIVNKWLDYHEDTLKTKPEKQAFSQYIKNIKILSRNPDVMLSEIMAEARNYERSKLLPSIPPTERKHFRSALSAIKNIKLKVRGEALGNILGPRRSECAAVLGCYCKPEELIKDTKAKTLFFASSILPVKVVNQYLIDKGFNPVTIYGGTNSNLFKIVEEFEVNPALNPCIATLQSLSEAVPMTMCDLLVFLNRPFRDGQSQQAISRAHRIGNPNPVTVINITLDTGDKPNVSSTTDAILADVRQMISELVGSDFIAYDDTDVEVLTVVDSSKLEPGLDFVE